MSDTSLTPRNASATRIGSTGAASNLNDPFVSASTAVSSASDGGWWTKEEARLYQEWASSMLKYNDFAPNPYFDYFYTGQDVRIKIDALDDNDYLPIYSFGYQVQQQKQPVYGYASYVYDAVLRGSRIITGAFSLVATEPFLLTNHIARSADLRAKTTQSKSTYALRTYDGDEGNINRYWRRNYDFNLDAGDKHLFSIHPPFNFLIKYGVQETSLVFTDPSLRVNEIKDKFDENSALWTNTNERLVDDPSARKTHILLENIELTSKSIEYDPNGDPILETYSFMARDERIVDDSATMNISRSLPQTGVNTGYDPNQGGGGPTGPRT